MFSAVNAVLLRPLPFRDSDRLVWAWESNPGRNIPYAFMSYANFFDWREHCASFESASAYSPGSANLTAGDEPERVSLQRVNASFFPMLGIEPVLGRDFLPDEDRPGAGRVAILDHGLWQRRFGSDRALIGRQVVLDGESYAVVGILPGI